jgi:hypothetical protein
VIRLGLFDKDDGQGVCEDSGYVTVL